MSQYFKRFRWVIARLLPALLCVVLIIVGGLVWVVVKIIDPGHQVTKNPSSAPSPSEVVAQSDPPELSNTKREVVTVVRKCIENYYKRDQALLSMDSSLQTRTVRERLEPYVTMRFLDENVSQLDSDGDKGFANNNGRQAVTSIEFGSGEPKDGIDVEISLITTQEGLRPVRIVMSALVTLERTSESWRVDSIIEIY